MEEMEKVDEETPVTKETVSINVNDCFAEAQLSIHRWIDDPIPVVTEDETLVKELKKRKKRLKRIYGGGGDYKKFVHIWYKEWDEKKAYPQKELDRENWERECNKRERLVREAERDIEREQQFRISKILQQELGELFDIFSPLKAVNDVGGDDSKALRYVIKTTSIEYLSQLLRKACLLIEVDVKKYGGWRVRTSDLKKFILTLKDRIHELGECIGAKDMVDLYEIALAAESFVLDIDNALFEKERRMKDQREVNETLERGFSRLSSHLSSLEWRVIESNRLISGVSGKLSDLISVSYKTLGETVKNGRSLDSISSGIGNLQGLLSSIGEKLDEMQSSMVEK